MSTFLASSHLRRWILQRGICSRSHIIWFNQTTSLLGLKGSQRERNCALPYYLVSNAYLYATYSRCTCKVGSWQRYVGAQQISNQISTVFKVKATLTCILKCGSPPYCGAPHKCVVCRPAARRIHPYNAVINHDYEHSFQAAIHHTEYHAMLLEHAINGSISWYNQVEGQCYWYLLTSSHIGSSLCRHE